MTSTGNRIFFEVRLPAFLHFSVRYERAAITK